MFATFVTNVFQTTVFWLRVPKCCANNLGRGGEMINLILVKFLICLKELILVIVQLLKTIVKCMLPKLSMQLTGPRYLQWVKPRWFIAKQDWPIWSIPSFLYRREMFFSLVILFRAKSFMCMAWIRTKMKKR